MKHVDVFLPVSVREVFRTYGVPVRYIRNWKRVIGTVCCVCNKPAQTAAHKIPYKLGIIEYGFTPRFLNDWDNLVPTCRQHNRQVEWSHTTIHAFIARLAFNE